MIKKIVYGISILLFLGCLGFAALVARPCGTNKVQFMNARNVDVRVTVSPSQYPDEKMVDYVLTDNFPVTFKFELFGGGTSYLITVENTETGVKIIDEFGYALRNDSQIYFFLIDDNDMHFNNWDMFDETIRGKALYVLYLIANEASCLDRRFFKNSY